MTKKITFVSPSVREFVANTAMLGGDKKQPKIDTPEEYSKLKDFLSNNKDLPKNERDYVKGYVKEYEKNITKAVMLEAYTHVLTESGATTAKDVEKEMLNYTKAALQQEGIKISKHRINRYTENENMIKDKTSILKLFGYENQ